ncbi:MAG: M23 family metallopeptidase [Bacteroidota bacterium]
MKKLITVLIMLLPVCTMGQEKEVSVNNYPQDYFRNPQNIPILLAGNFGECRMGHFHSGIDIKTNGGENLPVYAAADGYIARIKLEKGGFGHAIYIMHPNGYTTLYAHLNDFIPELQKYVRKIQYQKEGWETDIPFTPTQFPVKKGQQIAWSGNTGASTAPHLHFEIRSTKTEHPLNPELFGLPIVDKLPPVPKEVAIYDLTRSIYEQVPQVHAVHKKGNVYVPAHDTILVDPTVSGIGINVDDYMNGSDNTLTFHTATWYLDDSVQGEVVLDNIGYDETRYMHAYADYKTKKDNGSWIQCLFRLPGNNLGHLYKNLNKVKGAFVITDNIAHEVKVEIKDAFNNSSTIKFHLISAGRSNPLYCNNLYKANKVNNFENPNVTFYLDDTNLYDDICFQFDKVADANSYSDRYKIHRTNVPIHHYFELNIKPNKPIPFDLRSKIVLVCNDGKSDDGKATKYDDKGWYTASVRSFGEYRLLADTTAPVIKPLQKTNNLSKASMIAFNITDATTSVKKFRGTIDGKWVCFEQHNDKFFYKFDEHCPKGKHELVLTATDENNNTQSLHYTFTR